MEQFNKLVESILNEGLYKGKETDEQLTKRLTKSSGKAPADIVSLAKDKITDFLKGDYQDIRNKYDYTDTPAIIEMDIIVRKGLREFEKWLKKNDPDKIKDYKTHESDIRAEVLRYIDFIQIAR